MTQASKLIVHVVQHLAPGGLESLALDMLSFSSSRQRTLLVSLEGNRQQAFDKWPRLEQYRDKILFLNKPSGVSGKTFIQLYRLFRTLRPNVVHTHHIGPILYAGCAARLAQVETRIHTEHDAWHFAKGSHRRIQSFAVQIARPKWVADAELVREQIRQHFSHPVTVIKNGVDCEKFKPGSKLLARQALGLPTDRTLIGCAGRLEPVKGHAVLLHALAALPDNVSLVLAGAGSQLASLKQLSGNLNIQHRVIFLGLVGEMARFYQSLDLFCLPSLSEGFPLSTLEAQACDIVTIATQVGASEETICPRSGAVVEADNPIALAKAISDKLDSPGSVSPRQFVRQHNDIRTMIRAYDSLATEKHA
ncbi:glycosyltransferase [Vibrio sp. JPW-9-11-11]|uniref:glycosyltransferase n=1 Tax=Vibrio sp. JPW-9-11-11 TaxID=1416532 RepID=UPI0015940CD1|nr:glycosyltransferase [Vibrio sp. JPW-9-11-11]NVD06721.1 glycosyltransferase [Vibrio sp. JPW-9-11-11]